MFSLSHALEAQELAATDKEDRRGLLHTWQQLMDAHPVWQRLMQAAAEADYETVWRGLANRFD
jgi:hypothetical protein